MKKNEICVPARGARMAKILTVRDDAPDLEQKRSIEISFSSEAPYERWWGVEILGHSAAEMDTSFIGSGRAPLLIDHDRSIDSQVGVVEKVWLESGQARARIRFGKSARASEIFERVKDGELSNISVGYEIRKLRLESEADGVSTYRVTDWKANEISFVTVPADESVGVGRAQDTPLITLRLDDLPQEISPPIIQTRMAKRAEENENTEINPTEILKSERERSAEITALGAQFNMRDKANDAIAKGVTLAAFRGEVLAALGPDAEPRMAAANDIGLNKREAQSFSFLKAFRALANPTDSRAQNDAKFEFDVSAAAQEKMAEQKRVSRGFAVPSDVLRAPMSDQMRAAVAYGSAASAGNLVEKVLDSGNMIDMLRNKIVMVGLGARVIGDLTGDVDIPRQTGGSQTFWVGEDVNVGEGDYQTDLVNVRLKTIGCYVDVTRKMMAQSSLDMEALIRADFMAAIAGGIDRAGISGTGTSAQPLGLTNLVGTGAVAGGTNGAAPTWGNIIDLETQVAVANAEVANMAYLTNARVRGKLKQTEKASSTGQFVWDGADVNGYATEVTNAVPSNLTKGTANAICSAIIFGNFADALIAFWSGVDIQVDTAAKALAGGKRFIVHQDCDIAFRRAQSFAIMKDALTT